MCRVEAVGNAGLKLSKVTESDSGNYTLEVKVVKGPAFKILRRYVFLAVSGQ
jgi:hypothetical protein